jgi:uncharacterized protein
MLIKNKLILLSAILTICISGCGHFRHSMKKSQVVEARGQVFSVQAEPTNIVLMLPLKGQVGISGQAIRNGFLAAYYHSQAVNPAIKIKIIDTANGDISTLYQEAVKNGAEVIVGPLTKKEIEVLAKTIPLSIPTLALNTLDDYTHSFAPNLYQFGLLPQDEATQVAHRMMLEQAGRVAIIAPNNSWGRKIVGAFRAKYQGFGGQVVDVLNYNSVVNLSEQICPFLAYDALKSCGVKKHKKKEKKEPDDIWRRQDIDAIFLVAKPAEARQIVPLLKFYYAGDLPVFSISDVYSGTAAQNLDRDIEGIYFCDIPWTLQEPTALNSDLQSIRQQITKLSGPSYDKYIRLYALGIDAYNLAKNLNWFLNSGQSGVDGATGVLYLDEFNHIYRQLTWAQMKDGLPAVL